MNRCKWFDHALDGAHFTYKILWHSMGRVPIAHSFSLYRIRVHHFLCIPKLNLFYFNFKNV